MTLEPNFNDPDGPRGSAWPRLVTAVLVGLISCVIIWVATPYNNFILANSYIADNYLPVVALALALLMVLVLNPLLRWLTPRLAMGSGELSIALGMMLVACVLPSSGLLRSLPYSLCKACEDAQVYIHISKAYEEVFRPNPTLWKALFPDNVGFGSSTPVANYFLTELPKGAPVPWGAWLSPLLMWGTFLVFAWLMMIGLAMIVLPQWRRNERLPFPLLTLYQSLIQNPEEGHAYAPLFKQKTFWVAAIAVLVMHLTLNYNAYNPNALPAIPLDWSFGGMFQGEPWRNLPWHIHSWHIYFMFVGVAFFMPSRIGFSVWFFTVAYAIYVMIGNAYLPPFYDSTIRDHRWGAMFVLTIAIVWLGRAHWAHVFRCVFRAESEEDRKDRKAALMFVVGCIGMAVWLILLGVSAPWAVIYVGFGFMVCLLITRIVAETGMPFVGIDAGGGVPLVKLVPAAWLTPATLFLSGIFAILFEFTSRINMTAMTIHSLALDEQAPPRRQSRMAFGLIGLLVIGLLIAGAVHLYGSYHHSMSLDGKEGPISSWGVYRIRTPQWAVVSLLKGTLSKPNYNQPAHIAFGGALALGLFIASLASPKWPFHPIGLLMAGTSYASVTWASIFIGWAAKELILRYGGARLYRAARPVFLGLILGEIFAAVFWAAVPAILVLLDMKYHPVWIQPS